MLKPLTLVATLVFCVPTMLAIAQDSKEQSIIIAEGDSLPAVKVGDLVRLSASGAAGRTEIAISVQGPAKLVSTAKVRRFVNGKPMIGASVKEFVVEAEKKGTATISIKTTDVVEKKTSTKDYKLEIE